MEFRFLELNISNIYIYIYIISNFYFIFIFLIPLFYLLNTNCNSTFANLRLDRSM